MITAAENTTAPTPAAPDSQSDYSKFIALQSALNQADNALAVIDAAVNPKVTEVVDSHRTIWTAAQSQRDEAEREIKRLVEANPEWMDGKSVKTPFGTVTLRDTTSLEIPNPEGTVALIRVVLGREGYDMDPDQYLSFTEVPRKELLETLDDHILSKIGITRVKSTHVTVKPAKIEMSKETKAKKTKKSTAE